MTEGDSIETVRWQEGCLVESGWNKPGAKGAHCLKMCKTAHYGL